MPSQNLHHGEDVKIETSLATKPQFSARVHHPAVPGSFVYVRKGKKRIDQVLRGWCLRQQCIGVWQVCVNCHNINPENIEYTADASGITVDTTKDGRKAFKLFVPYPSRNSVTVDVPPDAELEGEYIGGKLKCRIPVVEIDERAFAPRRKVKKAELSKEREKKLVEWSKKLKIKEKRKKRALRKMQQSDEKKTEEGTDGVTVAASISKKPRLSEWRQRKMARAKLSNTLPPKESDIVELDDAANGGEVDLGLAIEDSRILEALSDARGPDQLTARRQAVARSKAAKAKKRPLGKTQRRKLKAAHKKGAQKLGMKKKKKTTKMKVLSKTEELSALVQESLVDELTATHENKMKAGRKLVLEKNTAIQSLFKERAERRKLKQEKREELKQRFLAKKEAKRKTKSDTTLDAAQ